MKKKLFRIFGILLAVVSLCFMAYPFVSNYLMSLNDESKIEIYESTLTDTDDDDITKELSKARAYNEKFQGDVMIADPFDSDYQPEENLEYESLLNINGDGMMGYLEIPVINVNLPIYHGASDDVLQKGAGHLQNTSLPVGGESTHAVLTGHTALSSAKLFSDINQLELGDVFYIHVLGEVLAYEVDQIKTVLPAETDDLKIVDGEDYVTLVTCAPYGVNTHRLLVRGTRVPYEEAQQLEEGADRYIETTWMREYRRALTMGLIVIAVVVIIFVILRFIIKHRKKRKEAEKADETAEPERPPD